jgi:hypothetical protein
MFKFASGLLSHRAPLLLHTVSGSPHCWARNVCAVAVCGERANCDVPLRAHALQAASAQLSGVAVVSGALASSSPSRAGASTTVAVGSAPAGRRSLRWGGVVAQGAGMPSHRRAEQGAPGARGPTTRGSARRGDDPSQDAAWALVEALQSGAPSVATAMFAAASAGGLAQGVRVALRPHIPALAAVAAPPDTLPALTLAVLTVLEKLSVDAGAKAELMVAVPLAVRVLKAPECKWATTPLARPKGRCVLQCWCPPGGWGARV